MAAPQPTQNNNVLVLPQTGTPPTVISRSSFSRAVVALGGHVASIDIQVSVAEAAIDVLMRRLHAHADQMEPVDGDRAQLVAAMNDLAGDRHQGEETKTLVTFDQLDQAAEKLEDLARKMRKLAECPLIPEEGTETFLVAQGIASAIGGAA